LLTASLSFAVSISTTSFQNGINGYTGTFDRYISDGTGDAGFTVAQTDGSLVSTVILNGFNQGTGAPPSRTAATPDVQGLLRFDNIFGSNPGQIPTGAFILDAELQLVTAGGTTSSATGQSVISGFNTTGASNTITGSVGPFGVAALKTPFSSSTDYYTSYPNSAARGPYFTENSAEYATRPVGAFGTNAVGQIGSANITNIVQQWSSGTLANNGVAVQAGIPGPIDDWHIHTTGYATPEGRPKLSVTYTTDPVTVTTFQPGVGTYADSSVTMTRVLSSGAAPTNGATITTNAGLDGMDATTNEQLALVKFSNVFGNGVGQAAPDKPVAKAWLVISTASASNAQTNDPYDVDIVRRSWDTTTTYNQFGTNPGVQFADGDITPTLDRRAGVAAGGESWFDVTGYLESVRNGATDNGLSIRARGTDGWNIFFNGASDLSVRPRLVVASQSTLSGGDFNNDKAVGPGDYVTWRKSNGTNNALANDGGLGTPVGDAHYTMWRENFGNTTSPQLLMNYDVIGLSATGGNNPATWDPNTQQTCGTLACQNSSQSAAGIVGLALSRGPGLASAGLGNGYSAQNWTNTAADGGTVDKARAIAMGDYFQFGFTVDATHQASLSTFDTTLRRSAAAAPMNYELQYSFDGFATAGVPILLNGNSEFKYIGRVSGNAPDPNPILTDPDRYMTLDSAGRPDAGVTPGDQITTFDLSQILALQNMTNKTITFRLFGWGDGTGANTNTIALGRMNGPRFMGFVAALSGPGPELANVPEPASATLVAIFGFVIAGVCRRRR
jgi:hypothetical protein